MRTLSHSCFINASDSCYKNDEAFLIQLQLQFQLQKPTPFTNKYRLLVKEGFVVMGDCSDIRFVHV